MSSKTTDKAAKNYSQIIATSKASEVGSSSTRINHPVKNYIRGVSEAPFKTISCYFIVPFEEGLKWKRVRRYGRGRNDSYAEALISRYFEKPEDINQFRKVFKLQVKKLREKTLQEAQEKVLFNILQHDSSDSLRKLDLEQFSEDDVRLIRLVVKLCELFNDSIEYVRIWLNSPHPYLGDRQPISYLLEGKPEAVEILTHAIETGQPL